MSNNRLLGSGVNYEALANLPPPKDEVQEFAPAWRFHKDCLEGKVVKTDKALEELDEAGWKDHPGKVRCLPGHEAIWEAELEKEIEEENEEDEVEVELTDEVDVDAILAALSNKDEESIIDHSGDKDED